MNNDATEVRTGEGGEREMAGQWTSNSIPRNSFTSLLPLFHFSTKLGGRHLHLLYTCTRDAALAATIKKKKKNRQNKMSFFVFLPFFCGRTLLQGTNFNQILLFGEYQKHCKMGRIQYPPVGMNFFTSSGPLQTHRCLLLTDTYR